MADVAHSGTSIQGGHTNAVAGGAAGFMSGTDKTNHDAMVAKLASSMFQVSTALTTGTTQPLSLADALFTGKTAGGAAVGTTGTAGIISASFASSGAETGTGSGQGGLGSAAASNQPYNSTDFPGQHFAGVLARANGQVVALSDVLSTAAAANLAAPVYVYISFRSDLGANLKWRAWFYYRDQTTGLETPFTPDGSLNNVTLSVPQVTTALSAPVGTGLQTAPANQGANEVEFGAIGDIAAVGTTAAGASGRVADAAHVHAHGNQASSGSLHAAATASVAGFLSAADKTLLDSLFSLANTRTALYEEDDFVFGGLVTSGAATITSNNVFGKMGWRVSSSGGAAAAVSLVTTGQSSQHKGVVQVDVGTGAGALIGILRSASGVPTTVFGTGQIFEWDWLFQVPTLSDGTNTYNARVGFLQSPGVAPTDGVVFEYSSASPASGNIIARAYKASAVVSATGGSSVPAVAGQWHQGRMTWDGSTLTAFVDGTNVGTIAAADMPTIAVAESAGLQRVAGGTARTLLIDRYRHLLQWTASRAG